MRWPNVWKGPSCLDLLKGTAINFLLIEPRPDFENMVTRARQEGLEVAGSQSLPSDVVAVDGKWPGVMLTRTGGPDTTSAGPTGDPWVDSNGWKVRLAAALHPGNSIWVDATPVEPRLSPESYVIGVADAATYGGRWIISLDDRLAEAVSARKPEALDTWKKLTAVSAFFVAHKIWPAFPPAAVLGIISDYSGQNEFFSNELLNLIARTNQQYRIILRSAVVPSSFTGLRAVLYADAEPPAPDLRKQILGFVEGGGLLITGPKWGELPGTLVAGEDYAGYTTRAFGTGKLTVSSDDLGDPYLVARDSAVLLSHRYDVLRFWNGGALGSYYTVAPGGKRAIVQMLFYASAWPHGYPATVRVVGKYTTAKLWTLDHPAQNLETEPQNDAVELQLPSVAQYAAVELEK